MLWSRAISDLRPTKGPASAKTQARYEMYRSWLLHYTGASWGLATRRPLWKWFPEWVLSELESALSACRLCWNHKVVSLCESSHHHPFKVPNSD